MKISTLHNMLITKYHTIYILMYKNFLEKGNLLIKEKLRPVA